MGEISVVLNVYKRPHLLKKQIESILNQTVKIKPENIHIWYNYSGDIQHYSDVKGIKTYTCNWNTKFWGRFTVPLLCDTDFIAMFDDDTIPEKKWLESCVKSFNKQPGIYGGSGIYLRSDKYMPHTKIGWNGTHSSKIEEVDLVGHAWFFHRDYMKYFWMEKPFDWSNGEDIMFSYLSQKYGNIKSFVPPHPESNVELWSTSYSNGKTFGSDENASWMKGNHYAQRDAIVEYCVKNGWKLVHKTR